MPGDVGAQQKGVRRFRVHGAGEPHRARVLVEPSFEAAAIAYVEHLPLALNANSGLRVVVHDIDSGQEHSFLIHAGPEPSVDD